MHRFEHVAAPLSFATRRSSDLVPPPGLVPIATVTFPVKLVAVFPASSGAATGTAGETGPPAVVVLGWTTNTSRVAVGAGAVMSNAVLVAPVRPAAVAWSV